MFDASIPPMPGHIADIRARYTEMLKQVRVVLGRDITIQQGLLIMSLGDKSVPAGDIKHDGYYEGTNATYNLNILEKAGFLKRSNVNGDRRRKLVALTPKGLELCVYLRRKLSVKETEPSDA